MKKSVKTIGVQIQTVEGFDVQVAAFDGNDARQRVDDYPFVNAANRSWTVAKWRDQRFWPSYWDYDVEVLDGNGSPVHGKTHLETVRASYYVEDLPAPRSRTTRLPKPEVPQAGRRLPTTPDSGARSRPTVAVGLPKATDTKPEPIPVPSLPPKSPQTQRDPFFRSEDRR